MRGSFRPSARCEDKTSLTASLTLRIRAPGTLAKLLGREDGSLHANALRELRLHITPELRSCVVNHGGRATHQRGRERGPLPEVVVLGLRHRGTEAPLKLCLERHDLLPLALEAPVVREVEMDLDETDETQESSRSTWRVSKTSKTSPSLTSP